MIARIAHRGITLAPACSLAWLVMVAASAGEAMGPAPASFAALVYTAGARAAWLLLGWVSAALLASVLPEHWFTTPPPRETAGIVRGACLSLLVAPIAFVALEHLAPHLVSDDLAHPREIQRTLHVPLAALTAYTLTLVVSWLRTSVAAPFWLLGVSAAAVHLINSQTVNALALSYALPIELVTLAACASGFWRVRIRTRLGRVAATATTSAAMASLVTTFALMPDDPSALRRLQESSPGARASLFALSRVFDTDGDGLPAFPIAADCNDSNPLQHPLALEIVGNGVDDNCIGGDLAAARPYGPPSVPSRSERYNVLLVTIDSLRADALRVDADRPSSLMPRLDAFARGGTLFTRAYAQAPFTNDSIVALLTGEYPMNTSNGSQLLGSEPFLAELLAAAGYQTRVVQQVWEPSKPHGNWRFYRGFHVVDRELVDRNHDYKGITSDETTSRALQHLDAMRQKTAPFFLWVHYFDPHGEYVAHAGTPFPGDTERDLYQQEVFATDRALGALLDRVALDGLLERTLVIVVGDHGEHLGERNRRGHAWWLGELSVRTVLVVRGPGVPAKSVQTRVRTFDVYPTVLALAAGIRTSSTAEHLAPVWNGTETRDRDVVARTQYKNVLLRSIHRGQLKLIEDVPGASIELYDLAVDPLELHDLVLERPNDARELRARLGHAWDLSINDTVLRRRSLQSARP